MGAHDQQLNIKGCSPGGFLSLRYPLYNTVVIVPSQKCIGRFQGCDSSQSQFLWQPSLPGAEVAFTATSGLRRVGGNHLNVQFPQRPPYLGQTMPIDFPSNFWRVPKMAGPVAIQRAEPAI